MLLNLRRAALHMLGHSLCCQHFIWPSWLPCVYSPSSKENNTRIPQRRPWMGLRDSVCLCQKMRELDWCIDQLRDLNISRFFRPRDFGEVCTATTQFLWCQRSRVWHGELLEAYEHQRSLSCYVCDGQRLSSTTEAHHHHHSQSRVGSCGLGSADKQDN